MKFKRKYTNRLIPAVMAGLALLMSGQTFASSEEGIDYAQSTSATSVTSTSSSYPTVLSSVNVVCPANGYLVAHAGTQFGLYYTGTVGTIAYGISLNSTAFDFNHYHYEEEYSGGDTFSYAPVSIQRMDYCYYGQSITYRFVAYLSSGLTTSTYAWQPRMSVLFIRDNI